MPDLPGDGPRALIWVFAYGSNMHLPDLARWAAERDLSVPVVECARVATLGGYALTWDYRSPTRRGGAANVRPKVGASTPGVALRIDAATLDALDQKEGHPDRYRRGPDRKPLKLPGGATLAAWVYEVTPDWRSAAPQPPRSDYLNLLVEAGQRFGLPAWHLRALAETPTADPPSPDEAEPCAPTSSTRS